MTTGGRAVVFGAGGALGAAWMVGALRALQELEGFDPLETDVLVGTSAGSVLAALLASGVTVGEMSGRLVESNAPHVAGTGPVNAFDVHDALATLPRPRLLPGNLRLALRTVRRPDRHTLMTLVAGLAPQGRGDLAPLAALIGDAADGKAWPRQPRTWIVAMDFDTGRRVVFGRADAPQALLADAVVASSAAPGFFPPVRIGERRYVDGGGVSMTNADVLVRCGVSEVFVLAPMLAAAGDRRRSAMALADRRLRQHVSNQLHLELARLRRAGIAARVLGPTPDDLEVMGVNVMNPSRRAEVLWTSIDTTRRRLSPALRTGGDRVLGL